MRLLLITPRGLLVAASLLCGNLLFAADPASAPEQVDADASAAVALGLKWLAAQQASDGSWSFAAEPDPGSAVNDPVAATSLALRPFLKVATHEPDGPYKETIAKGIRFLSDQMVVGKDGGDMRNGKSMYTQGLAAIALAEACAVTQDEKLRTAAQRAVDFILFAQDPQGGGWRYQPQQPGDTSVLGWQLTALVVAQRAGLAVPQKAFEGAVRYLDQAQLDEGARYGYMPGTSGSHSMSAVGLLCRIYLGWTKDMPPLNRGVELIAEIGPGDNSYYNYYATRLLSRYGGDPWRTWRSALVKKLAESQAKEGKIAGSWSSNEPWHKFLGRVGETAFNLATLQVNEE